MTIKEYLENLNRIKRLAVNRWGNLSSIERTIVDGSFEWLVDNLEIKKGEIQVDEDLSAIMDQFMKAVVDTINEVPLYQSKLKSFLQDLTTLQTNNKLFHSTTNNFNIETAGVNDVQKAVVNEVIDQYLGNGLNAHFAAPLKDNIFRNILAGANMRDVKQVLQTYILSGEDKSGKLNRYIDQTAQQAVDSYSGAINQQLVKEFNFTGYIISGSLIETSSLQCVTAVEEADQQFGYLSFEQWEEILQIARENPKAKLIEGTTIKNLPLNKLHHGCRHEFTPMIMSVPKKDKKIEPKKAKEPLPAKKKEPVKKKTPVKEVPNTAFKPVTTTKKGKDVAKAIFQTNLGLNVKGVKVSGELTVERMNRMNEVLDQLTREYVISPAVNKQQPTEISFRSTTRAYGLVKTYNNGTILRELNFGHMTDTAKNRQNNETDAFNRPKSRVDEENSDLATTVHEFAHTITISQQQMRMKDDKSFADFWPEMTVLRNQYLEELRAIMQKNNHDEELNKMFLGKYASTNLNEFMAEGFTEYRLSSNPTKYAEKIGNLIDKYFKK